MQKKHTCVASTLIYHLTDTVVSLNQLGRPSHQDTWIAGSPNSSICLNSVAVWCVQPPASLPQQRGPSSSEKRGSHHPPPQTGRSQATCSRPVQSRWHPVLQTMAPADAMRLTNVQQYTALVMLRITLSWTLLATKLIYLAIISCHCCCCCTTVSATAV